MFEIEKEARLCASVGVVDQHAALDEKRLESLQHDVD